MKKTGILLLTSATLLFSSCGTKYTLKGGYDNTLTLRGSCFTIVSNEGKFIKTKKGTVEKLEENNYKLTVTNENYRLEKGEYLVYSVDVPIGSIFTPFDIDKLNKGRTVSFKLDVEDYYTFKVSVNTFLNTYSIIKN